MNVSTLQPKLTPTNKGSANGCISGSSTTVIVLFLKYKLELLVRDRRKFMRINYLPFSLKSSENHVFC